MDPDLCESPQKQKGFLEVHGMVKEKSTQKRGMTQATHRNKKKKHYIGLNPAEANKRRL